MTKARSCTRKGLGEVPSDRMSGKATIPGYNGAKTQMMRTTGKNFVFILKMRKQKCRKFKCIVQGCNNNK